MAEDKTVFGKIAEDGLGSLETKWRDPSVNRSSTLFDDVEVRGGPPVYDMPAPPPSQECTEETMVCLRGPCMHLWPVVQRLVTGSEIVNIQQAQHCSFHEELINMADENIYDCGQWWPAFLVWVPESFRAFLRPKLKAFWDNRLKRKDPQAFEWKWWPDDVWQLPPERVHELRQKAIKQMRAKKEGGDGYSI